MITPELIEKAANYVKLKTANESAGHDWFHVQRVVRLAKLLQVKEGGDLPLIELSAYLHNVGDINFHEYSEEKGLLSLFGMMDVLEIDEELKHKVLEIVNFSKYRGDETKSAVSIEAKIIQDANWLDSMGAIGVARGFAAGGYLGRNIYDPAILVRKKLNKFEYQKKKRESTTINSFYEKAFKLPGLMNTQTAKKIAKYKTKAMRDFVDDFMKEWDGKDLEEALKS